MLTRVKISTPGSFIFLLPPLTTGWEEELQHWTEWTVLRFLKFQACEPLRNNSNKSYEPEHEQNLFFNWKMFPFRCAAQALGCVWILTNLCLGGCCRVVGLLLLLTLLQLLFLHEGQLLLVLLVLLSREHCGQEGEDAPVWGRIWESCACCGFQLKL